MLFFSAPCLSHLTRAAAALAFLLPLTAQMARAESCDDTVMAAQMARFQVANRAAQLSSIDDKSALGFAVIEVNGKQYVERPDRQWQVTDWTPDAEAAYFKANHAWTDCEPAGSEMLDGVAADLFVSRTVVAGAAGSVRNWISHSSGLPLKTEIRVEKFGIAMMQTSLYTYGDVRPPDLTVPAPVVEEPVPAATGPAGPDEGTCRHPHSLYDRMFRRKNSCAAEPDRPSPK